MLVPCFHFCVAKIRLLAILCLLAAAMYGQASRASLFGRVADRSDAGIPGARVRVIRIDTNETFEVYSDTAGFYSFPFLNAGVYNVQVALIGFKGLRREGVVLQTDDTLNLTLKLEVGDVNEHVTIAADTERLETTTASRTYRFDPVKLKDLPLIGRQAYSLVALTPGVIFTQEQFGTTGFAGLHGWQTDGKFVINGGREGVNQFLLNGAPVSMTGRWQFSPSVDAIQEFKVMINTYDAQFGRTGGGTVVTTLRSGTNYWHGQTYEYFHNAVFDANTIQNNLEGAPRGRHDTHQFGATIGGPLRRNKDFLFLSFEGFHEIVPYPLVSNTPPVNIRDGQHFSSYGIKIYDPLSTHECVDGVDTAPGSRCLAAYIRNPFPGSAIPLSRISPIGKAIIALYPAPNVKGLTQNYVAGANTSQFFYNQPLGRWDHLFSDKDRISAVFAVERGDDNSATNGFPGAAELGDNVAHRLDQNYILEWTHILSPSLVADVRFSFGRFTEYFPNNTEGAISPAELGILQLPHPPAVPDSAPKIDLDLYNSIIGSSYSWSTQNQFDFQPGIIQTKGRHILHYGFEFAYNGMGNAGYGSANGQFSFDRSWTQQYANRGSDTSRSQGSRDGSGIADLLLGYPSSGVVDYNENYYRTWPYYAAYFQDNWKISKKVTLNLGLRYDVQLPFVERFNRVNDGFDFTVKNPNSDSIIANWKQIKESYDATKPKYLYPNPPAAIYGAKQFAGPQSRRPYDTDWTDLQPRVGVAWAFRPKTVLRAGAGIFYRTATQLNQNDGFNQRTDYVSSRDGGLTPSAGLSGPYSLQNPFPNGIQAPTGSSLGAMTNAGSPITFDGRQRPIPRTYEYSFGFQRELPWGIMAEMNYSGSQTVHDSMAVALDNVSYAQLQKGQKDSSYLSRRLPNPFSGILSQDSDLGSGSLITAYNLLRPYPLYDGVTLTTAPWAHYRYDSLQVMAERRVADLSAAGVFTFLLSYTFSKSFATDHRLNPWNLDEKPIHELSALDKPQVFAFTGLWDLPFGWGRHYFADVGRSTGAFVNGWAVDWILTYSSGYPVNVPDAIYGCGSYDAVGGQTADQWFNNDPKCYKARTPYSLITNPDRFSTIRNPTAPQLDLSVEKTLWFGERYSVQLRGESFNVTNTPIRPAPNTNYKDPRFGQLPIQQNNFPRYIQLAAKFVW